MIPTPPLPMRNLVTFSENNVFAHRRLPALSANVRNYCDSAPRNRLSLFIDGVEKFPLVPECATARTAISTDPSCQRLPMVGVGFHSGPAPESALLYHSPKTHTLAYNTFRGQRHDLEINTTLVHFGIVDVDRRFGIRRFDDRIGSAFLDSKHGSHSHNVRLVRCDLSDRVSPPVVAKTTASISSAAALSLGGWSECSRETLLPGQDFHQIAGRMLLHVIVDKISHKLWKSFQGNWNRVSFTQNSR